MAGRIHFVSGKTLDVNSYEFDNLPVTLNSKGIKVKRLSTGHLIPMNSTTMEYIEYIPDDEAKTEEVKVVVKKTTQTKPTMHGEDAILKPMKEAREKPKVKTNDEKLAEMIEKSNCKHEPEKMELYVQHTAKGLRYFPVCSFCGKREKYISERKIIDGAYEGTPNEKWTADDVAHAKPWMEK